MEIYDGIEPILQYDMIYIYICLNWAIYKFGATVSLSTHDGTSGLTYSDLNVDRNPNWLTGKSRNSIALSTQSVFFPARLDCQRSLVECGGWSKKGCPI